MVGSAAGRAVGSAAAGLHVRLTLRSRWTQFFSCMYLTALRITPTYSRQISSEYPTVLRGGSTAAAASIEGAASVLGDVLSDVLAALFMARGLRERGSASSATFVPWPGRQEELGAVNAAQILDLDAQL